MITVILPRALCVCFLEHGGNPNLTVGGEDLFENLDFDVVFDVVEQNNK